MKSLFAFFVLAFSLQPLALFADSFVSGLPRATNFQSSDTIILNTNVDSGPQSTRTVTVSNLFGLATNINANLSNVTAAAISTSTNAAVGGLLQVTGRGLSGTFSSTSIEATNGTTHLASIHTDSGASIDSSGISINSGSFAGNASGVSNVVAAGLHNGVGLTNDIVWGSLGFRSDASLNIDQQQIFSDGGPGGGGLRIVDGDLGGTAAIEHGNFYGGFVGNGQGVTNTQPAMGQFYVTNYGAVCDGITLYGVKTTSGSTTVTVQTNGTTAVCNFTAADIGKYIFVAYGGSAFSADTNGMSAFDNFRHFSAAGTNGIQSHWGLLAQITAVVNTTNVTVSVAAGNSQVNTWARYGHDDTAGMQAAINAACAANGGTVIGAGLSMICGNIYDPNTSSAYGLGNHKNAQLYIPDFFSQTFEDATPTIRFVGPHTGFQPQLQRSPANPQRYGWTVFSALPRMTNWSALINGSMTNAAWVQFNSGRGGLIPDNHVRFESEHMNWEGAPDNDGAVLNLQAFPTVTLKDLSVNSGNGLYNTNQCLHTNTAGILLAGGNSGGEAKLDNVVISAFYSGLGIGEHVSAYPISIFSCWNAINLCDMGGHHDVIVADIEDCFIKVLNESYGTPGLGDTICIFATFTTENYFTGSWSKGGPMFYDPGNTLGGQFIVEVPVDQAGGAGVTNMASNGYQDGGGTKDNGAVGGARLSVWKVPAIGGQLVGQNIAISNLWSHGRVFLGADTFTTGIGPAGGNTGGMELDANSSTFMQVYPHNNQADTTIWDPSTGLQDWTIGMKVGAVGDANSFAPNSSYYFKSRAGGLGFNTTVGFIGTNGIIGAWNGFVCASNATATWPTAAFRPGDFYIGNSGGAPYLLSSATSGTAWVATNSLITTNHLIGKSYALVAAATTAFWAPQGNAVTNVQTSDVDLQSRQALGTGFKIVGLYFKASSAPVGGQTYIATVMTNGVATGTTVTITGSATTGSDFSHPAIINAQGDSIGIKIVSSATAVSSRYDWDILYTNQ